ncbi:MAG: hypothetical protein AMXMBFR61_25060 [Fimbriimonadales bacterium]
MINRIVLVGRLTRDPELRTTNTGKQVASFRIAVDRAYSQEPQADFINVVCWGQTAEFVSNYLTKGRLVGVDGRLQTRTWEDQEGRKRYEFEVVAERVKGLDRPRDSESRDDYSDFGDADIPEPLRGGNGDPSDPFETE